MPGDHLQLVLLFTCIWGVCLGSKSFAQITPDSSLVNESSTITENAIINKEQVVDLIEGGADRGETLFHSFQEFNVLSDQQVYFANPSGIDQIITRVTGSNPSNILGRLGVDGTADLFLLNPNGILFGENASLDVQSSFLATTADSFIFDDDINYDATNPEIPPLLNIKIPTGVQFGSDAGSIEVRGTGHQLGFDSSSLMPTGYDSRPSGLAVPTGRTLALLGGELNLDGGNLTASEGTIELAAIGQSGVVGLTTANNTFRFNYDLIDTYGDINLDQESSLDVRGGKDLGSVILKGHNINLQDGSVIITSKLSPGNSSNSGEIDLIATNSLNIANDNTNFPSAIFTQIQQTSNKPGADIKIKATNLKLQNNALIVSTVTNKGRGGNINIDSQQAQLVNNSDLPYSTGIYSQALSGARGDVGIITLELDNLQLLNNGQSVLSVDDEDDLENIIGENRAENLEDFIEDNEAENVIVGLSESGQRTLVLPGGGEITSRNRGEGENGVAIIATETIRFLDASEPEVPEPEDPEPETPEPEVPEPEDPEPEDPEPETPEAEVPEPEVPEPEVPEAEVPQPETPEAEDPELEDPELEDPEPEDPEPEDPEPETPEAEVPEPEVPEPEVPEAEVPQPETPEPEDPELEDPEPETPEPEVPEPETPEAEAPEPEVLEPEVPEPETPEPETPEPEVPEPEVPEPETPEPEAPVVIVEEPTNTVENLPKRNSENESQQPDLVQDASIQKTYIFELDNGESIVVDAEDLNEIIESSSISDSADGSATESESVQIFINGILVARTYDPDFDLTSACRIGNSNFVSVGKGGVAENPFNGISQNITIPDLEISSQLTESVPDTKLGKVELTKINPVIEAQSWKINQEGKVELITKSQQTTLASIEDLPNCLRDHKK